MSILSLSKDHVESLKKASNVSLNSQIIRPYTRYKVVSTHIWKSACKARKHVYEQPTSLSFSIELRNRVHPPLPPNYLGKAILDMVASSRSGESMTKPISYTCAKIREAIDKVNDE